MIRVDLGLSTEFQVMQMHLMKFVTLTVEHASSIHCPKMLTHLLLNVSDQENGRTFFTCEQLLHS